MGVGAEVSVWPEGRQCAVSLTYDGAVFQHLAAIAPKLDALQLRGTFFASPSRLLDDPLRWKKASERHEIGNHSLFAVADGGTLLNWNFDMVEADVRMTSSLITEIIGQECLSFALPGWSTVCAQGDYLPLVQRLVPYIRSERRALNEWDDCDLGYVGSYPGEDVDVPKLCAQARKTHGWLVLRFVGDLKDVDKHERLLKGLSAASEEVWVAPFGAVAARVRDLRQARSIKS